MNKVSPWRRVFSVDWCPTLFDVSVAVFQFVRFAEILLKVTQSHTKTIQAWEQKQTHVSCWVWLICKATAHISEPNYFHYWWWYTAERPQEKIRGSNQLLKPLKGPSCPLLSGEMISLSQCPNILTALLYPCTKSLFPKAWCDHFRTLFQLVCYFWDI